MTSRAGGRPKGPFKPSTAFKKGHKAIYAKVPSVSESSLKKKEFTYTKLYKLKRPPVDKKKIRELGNKFVGWSLDQENIIWEEFCIEEGITPSHFERLKDKDEEFADCFEMAQAALASRRQRIVGRDMLKSMHPLYDPRWRSYLDSQKDKDSKNTPSNITVITNSAERTDIVPERKVPID